MKTFIPEDEVLLEISRQIDEYLFDICEKYEMPFLQVASITLARLGVIAKDIQEEQHLIRLMKMSEMHLNAEQTPFNAGNGEHLH